MKSLIVTNLGGNNWKMGLIMSLTMGYINVAFIKAFLFLYLPAFYLRTIYKSKFKDKNRGTEWVYLFPKCFYFSEFLAQVVFVWIKIIAWSLPVKTVRQIEISPKPPSPLWYFDQIVVILTPLCNNTNLPYFLIIPYLSNNGFIKLLSFQIIQITEIIS